MFHIGCRMVAAGDARVQSRRQQLGQRAQRSGGGVDPAEEPRAAVAHRVREDAGADFIEERVGVWTHLTILRGADRLTLEIIPGEAQGG